MVEGGARKSSHAGRERAPSFNLPRRINSVYPKRRCEWARPCSITGRAGRTRTFARCIAFSEGTNRRALPTTKQHPVFPLQLPGTGSTPNPMFSRPRPCSAEGNASCLHPGRQRSARLRRVPSPLTSRLPCLPTSPVGCRPPRIYPGKQPSPSRASLTARPRPRVLRGSTGRTPKSFRG